VAEKKYGWAKLELKYSESDGVGAALERSGVSDDEIWARLRRGGQRVDRCPAYL